MNHTIQNETMSITVADHGAELVSIFDRKNSREVLWQADPAFWVRHSPILFPQVGKSYGGYYTHQGIRYPMGQHGFARDCDFTLVEQTDNTIVHRLTDSEETRKKYPFPFELTVTHTLCGREISVGWTVVNRGTDPMYFTIGAHPAFRVPVLPDTKQSDYSLQFRTDSLQYYLLDTDSGTANVGTQYDLPVSNGRSPIASDLFDKDALVFDHQIDWAGIAMPDGTPYVSVSCEGFPNFGIWSKPNAPFVCLEPWDGRCDNTGYAGELSEKPGILSLAPQEQYDKSYQIIIH